jgi:hypothetical protein
MKIFYITLIWVIYIGLWIFAWKTNNGMLGFVMTWMTFLLFPLTGTIIEHFDNLKIKQL